MDTSQLRSVLDAYGLSITGHTDPCLPYAYPLQAVRDGCFQELQRCAGIFSALKATVMNIHPCYYCPPGMRRDLVDFNIESLKPVAAMALSHGLTLVLENYKAPFDQVATFRRVLAEVPGLKLHLDFGHTNFGRDGYEVFCRELGDHIRHVHFSDNRSRADDHMPLGVGGINWKKAVQTLKATATTTPSLWRSSATTRTCSTVPGYESKNGGRTRARLRRRRCGSRMPGAHVPPRLFCPSPFHRRSLKSTLLPPSRLSSPSSISSSAAGKKFYKLHYLGRMKKNI